MHKKIIRGKTYYYTSVREDGKVRTIYLGMTEEDALRKERELHGEGPNRFVAGTVISLMLAVLVLFGPSFTGLLVLEETTHYQQVNVSAEGNYRFNWTPQIDGNLSSFSINGEVEGTGNAVIFLSSRDKDFVVFDKSIQNTSVLKNSCDETCGFNDSDYPEPPFEIILTVENGTTVKLESINYTIILFNNTNKKLDGYTECAPKENITDNGTDTNRTWPNGTSSEINVTSIFKQPPEDNDTLVWNKTPVIDNQTSANITLNITKPQENVTARETKNLKEGLNLTVDGTILTMMSNLRTRLGVDVPEMERYGDRFNISFEKRGSSVRIRNVDVSSIRDLVFSETETAIFRGKKIMLGTETIGADIEDNATATLYLRKTGPVNAILKCGNYSTDTGECSEWAATEIEFTDNGTHIIFNVTGFSGYAGAFINIINVQSYPTINKNWTVMFTTNGTAGLYITAINGTVFGDSYPDDLEFLELRCGDEILQSEFNGTTVYYASYSCNETGYEMSRVMTYGKHYLEFSFGGDIKYAYNDVLPPHIDNPFFNETAIEQGESVLFNVTSTDTDWVDTVIATFAYPNSTEQNVTLARDTEDASSTTPDLEDGTAGVVSYSELGDTFDNGFYSDTYEQTMTGTSHYYALEREVSSTGRAFVLVKYAAGHDTGTCDGTTAHRMGPDDNAISCYLYNTTHVLCERQNSGTDIYISYQVVEALNQEFIVYRNYQVFDSSTLTYSPSIGGTVTGENCFAWVNGMKTATTSRDFRGLSWIANVSDGSQTTLNLRRDSAGAGHTGTMRWVVVEFNKTQMPEFNLTRGQVSVTNNYYTSQQTVSWSGNKSASVLFHQFATSGDDGLDQHAVAGEIDSDSQISFWRHSSNWATTVQYYILDFGGYAGGTSNRQEGVEGEDSLCVWDVTLGTSVDINRTLVSVSNTMDGDGTAQPRSFLWFWLSDGTTLEMEKRYDGNNQRVAWHVLELAHNTTKLPDTEFTEANLTGKDYTDIMDDYVYEVTAVNVTVYVSNYNTTCSDSHSNTDPGLWLELYNGSGWVNISSFGVTGTGSFKAGTQEPSVLSGWVDESYRNVRIRGTGFDSNATTGEYDEINWTQVTVEMTALNQTGYFTCEWTDTAKSGRYNITDVWANDTLGNENSTTHTELYFDVSDTTPPMWSGNVTDILTQYDVSGLSYFNITWEDPDSSVSTVYIEGNWTGEDYNHTPFSTDDVYQYNATMPAGDFYWRSWANDSEDNWNVTDTWYFSVSRADMPITLLVNGSETPGDFWYGNTTNASGYREYPEGSLQLYLNSSPMDNPHIANLGAGYWNYTLVFSETGNYTENSTSAYFTMNRIGSSTTLYINSSGNDQEIWYGNTTNATAYTDYGSISLYINGTQVSHPMETLMGAGYWNFTAYSSGDGNHTESGDSVFLKVNKISSIPTLYINGSASSQTFTYEKSVSVTGYCDYGSVSLHRNGTSIGNPYLDLLGVAYWNFTLDCSGDDNHTESTKSLFLTMQKKTPVITLYLNGSTNEFYALSGEDVNHTAIMPTLGAARTVSMHQNGSLMQSGTVPITNISSYSQDGDYEIKVNYTGDDNYTYAQRIQYVHITASDIDPPDIFIDYPANNSHHNESSVYFNLTLDQDAAWCGYSLDSAANVTMSNTSKSVWYYLVGGLSETTHSIVFWCNDTIPNMNSTSPLNFTVDLTEPGLVIFQPQNQSYTSDVTGINYTYSDNLGDCSWSAYSLNSGSNVSLSCQNYSGSGIGSSQGTNGLTVWARDEAGNTNQSSVYYLYDSVPPQWSGIQENVTNQSAYDPERTYQFNVTWTDATTGVDTVVMNFNGQEYAPSYNTSTVFTFEMHSLGTGSYGYYWTANDTMGNSNQTNAFTYTVNQAPNPVYLYLNGSEGNMSATYEDVINATAYVFAGSVSLYRNGSPVGNPEEGVLGAGTHVYVANTTGNQNYSSNETTFNVTIAKRGVVMSLNLDPASGITYGTQTRAICQPDNGQSYAELFRNGTGVTSENNTYVTVGAGYWEYVCNASETDNYTSAETSQFYQVNKAPNPIYLYIDNNQANRQKQYGTSTNVSAYIGYGTAELYRNGTQITNPDNTLYGVGYYVFKTNSTGDDNHTGNETVWNLTVTKAQTILKLFLNGVEGDAWIQTEEEANHTIYSSYNNIVYLYRDGGIVESGPAPLTRIEEYSSEENFNITANCSGDDNHTEAEVYYTLHVLDPNKWPPTIDNPHFNDTEIEKNGAIEFNVTSTDINWVDEVIATFSYPNTTQQNVSLQEGLVNANASSDDLEPGTQNIRATYIAGDNETIGESGELNISNFQWHMINFTYDYEYPPVVVAVPVTDTDSDSNGLIPVITNVTNTSFWINLCEDAGLEYCSATVEEETVNYFVFDVNKTDKYSWIDVGTVVGRTNGSDTIATFNLTFTNAPYVWASVQTDSNGGSYIAPTIWTDTALTTAVELLGCEHPGTADACGSGRFETFGYVAIDVANVNITDFEYGTESISASTWTDVTFGPYPEVPKIMVTQNDDNGAQDPQYSWARYVTTSSAQIRYCEQDGEGDCDSHNGEAVMWFTVPEGGIFIPGTLQADTYDEQANLTGMDYASFINETVYSISSINVTVFVSEYNSTGSDNRGNTDPDLWLEVYNGSGWVNISAFGFTGTGNRSVLVTEQDVLDAWQNRTAERDMRISGVYFDANYTGQYDEINWTQVYISVDAENQTGYFTYEWTDTPDIGYYNVTRIYSNDTRGNMNMTTHTDVYFEVPDDESPWFSGAAANETLLGENDAARFSISIYDAHSDVDYANGTINGVTYDLVDSGGDVWYYDWVCTSSDSDVGFTWAGARDTPGNWNETGISGVSLECDANNPIISGETKSPDPSYNDDDVLLNASVMDPEYNLHSVWISGNWTGSWVSYYTGFTVNGNTYSYRVTSGNFSNQESVGWRYYANDTAGNVRIGILQVFTVQNRNPYNVTLLEPGNDTATADNTTYFNWTDGYDPDGDSFTYTLQVDNDSSFTSLAVEKTGLGVSEYTLASGEALPDDVYYWRVYTADPYSSNVSDVWVFEINKDQAISVALSGNLSAGINWTIISIPIFNQSADGNNGSGESLYYVEVSASGTTADVYIKADGDLVTAGEEHLGLSNETFSYNSTNSSVPSGNKFSLTTQYSDSMIGSNMPDGSRIYIKFFLSAPSGQPAGTYTNTVEVKGVPNGQSP